MSKRKRRCRDCFEWTPENHMSEHMLCPTCEEVLQEGLAHFRKLMGLKGVGDHVEGTGIPPAIEQLGVDMRERHKLDS